MLLSPFLHDASPSWRFFVHLSLLYQKIVTLLSPFNDKLIASNDLSTTNYLRGGRPGPRRLKMRIRCA